MKRMSWIVLTTAFAAVEACTVELGNLGDVSVAYAINSGGDVVGIARLPNSSFDHAVLFPAAGTIVDLGTLPQHVSSDAHAIADDGTIVGSSGSGTARHAVLWSPSRVICDLGQLAPDMETRATGINNRGVIIGVANEYVGSPPSVLMSHPWVRVAGSTQLVALPVPTGTTEAEARAINDSGLIVGDVAIGSTRHALMWDILNGSVRDITPATAASAMAYAINSSGRVVGRVTAPDGLLHAAVWQPGSAVTFLTGPTGCSSTGTGASCSGLSANDINDEGVIVGSSDLQSRAGSMSVSIFHAVRWAPLPGGTGYGEIQYYQGLSQDQASSIAYSINNAGAAVGVWNPISVNHERAVRFDP